MPTFKQSREDLIAPGGPSGIIGYSMGVTLNATQSTPIYITGGTEYMITNILITHASSTPGLTAIGVFSNADLYSATYSIYFTTDDPAAPEICYLKILYTSNNYIGLLGDSGIFNPTTSRSLFSDTTLYFTVDVPQGSPITVDIFIYGVFVS